MMVGRGCGHGFAVPGGYLAEVEADVTHPRHQLDAVIHNPTRFSIRAALPSADKV